MNNSDIKKEVELWMEFYRAFNDDNEFRSINAFDRNRFEMLSRFIRIILNGSNMAFQEVSHRMKL